MARSFEGDAIVRRICQITVVFVAVVWSTRLADPVQLPKATVTVLLAFSVLVVILWRAGAGAAIVVPPKVFSAWVGIFIVASLISVIAADSIGRATVGTYGRWTGLALYSACAAFALVVAAYFPLPHTARLLRALGVATFLVASYGVFQGLSLDPFPWSSDYGDKVFSSLGNPNFAAAFIGFGVPVWTWMVFEARHTKYKVLAGAVVVLHLVAQVWTGSLQGPVVTLVGAGIFAFVIAGRAEAQLARRIRAGLLGTGGAGLLFAVAGYLGRGPFAFLDWTTVEIRLRYWRAGLGMFADAPLFGHGFTGYAARYRQYRSLEAWEAVGPFATNDAPHSVPLNMFVSGGVVLGLAYLAVLGLVSWFAIRTVFDVDRNDLPVVAAVAGAWGGYVIQLFVSIDVPPLAITGWMLAGLVVAVRTPASQRVSLRRVSKRVRAATKVEIVGTVGLVLVLGFASWAMAAQALADSRFSDGQLLAEVDGAAALLFLERAQELAPWEPRYVRAQGDLLLAVGQAEEALETYESATRVDPYSWEAHVSAARLSARVGDLERAARWFEVALQLDPIAPEIKVAAAEVALLRGDAFRSVELLEQALTIEPNRAEWWLHLAEALEFSGRLDDADDARCTAQELNPSLDVTCGASG